MNDKMRYIFQSALRRVYKWHPDKKAAKDRAKLSSMIYFCSTCHQAICDRYSGFTDSEQVTYKELGVNLINGKIQVDHKEPVDNPHTGFTDWNDYMDRLDCGLDGLQVLCNECHYMKSQIENQERRERKKDVKNR